MRPAAARAALLLALAAAGPARAEAAPKEEPGADRVGILPIAASDAALGAGLSATLGRRVAERGARGVLGPSETRDRLGQAAGVTGATRRSRGLVEAAERATLGMERERALTASRAALGALGAIGGRYQAPALVARAHVAAGLAELLEPADAERAGRHFAAAFAADPTYRPDERRLSPRVLRMLEAARSGPATVTPPSADERARLARRARLGHLVWIGVAPADEPGRTIALTVHLYRKDGVRLAAIGKQSSAENVSADAAALVVRVVSALPRRQSPTSAGPATVVGAGRLAAGRRGTTAAPSKPWYRRWWIWTLVGVAAAGAGVGLTLALTGDDAPVAPSPPRTGFDFRFEFR